MITMVTMMMVTPEAKRSCFADFDSGTERGTRGHPQRLGMSSSDDFDDDDFDDFDDDDFNDDDDDDDDDDELIHTSTSN